MREKPTFPVPGKGSVSLSVWLYSIPDIAAIKDITVKTDFTNTTGKVEVAVVSDRITPEHS